MSTKTSPEWSISHVGRAIAIAEAFPSQRVYYAKNPDGSDNLKVLDPTPYPDNVYGSDLAGHLELLERKTKK